MVGPRRPGRTALVLVGCLCLCDAPGADSQHPSPFVVRVGTSAVGSASTAPSGQVAAKKGCTGTPASAPQNASAWRTTCWCGSADERCPDAAVAAFVRTHMLERELAARSPGAIGERRFLVCKPMGGVGNWITGLLSCAAFAMATNRSLLLAPPPPTPADKTTVYDAPVETLFDLPIPVSLSVLGSEVADIPFLTDTQGRARDDGHLQMVDLRAHDLLCANLTERYRHPLVVMPAHLWLGAITRYVCVCVCVCVCVSEGVSE